jgi:putative ABC transport system permease protein
MHILREWIHRILGTLGPRRQDCDLEEELRLHLELAAEDARRGGDSPGDAVRAARLRAGGLSQAMDALRDQRGLSWMRGIGQDVRLAFRTLRATPAITAVAILSLTLAIGANTAIFSIVNGLILRALPVREPGRLVLVTDGVMTDEGTTRVRVWDYAVWEQIQQRPQLFDAVTAWSYTRFDLASGGETKFVDALWASGSYFEALGVPSILGRTFAEDDDQPGGGPDGPVTVVSYGCWQRQYGGAADVIGRTVRLDGVSFTIIGVTPPNFFGTEVGRAFDFIVPLRLEATTRGRDSALQSPGTNFLSIMARLRPEQSLESAAEGLRSVQMEIREATLGPWSVGAPKHALDRYLKTPFTLVPAATGYSNLRRSYARPLSVIAVVVGLVLLIGCVNIANLSLARAIGRRHELGVRRALGASRWRLARQFFTESVVLSGAGAALGVLVAIYSSRFLVRQLSTSSDPVFVDVTIDGRVLAFAAAVTALTAVLFGTAPALRAAGVAPTDALKQQGRTSTDSSQGGLMAWLVVVQVALSVVLVVAAGLFIRSFGSLATRQLGLRPDQVLVVTIDSHRTSVDPTERVALYERAREAVLALPNVEDAAVSFLTPVGGGGFTPPVEISTGTERTRADANGDVFGNLISPGWFATFGTRLVRGRDFTDSDRKGARRVAIVNEAFERKLLGGATALGRTIALFPNSPMAITSIDIIGVAVDAVYSSPHEPAPPTWYVPIAQFDVPGFPLDSARLSVRARAGSPALLTKSVVAAITAANPQLALTFTPLTDQIHASLTQERVMAQLSGSFGVLALLLAGLGLYGVTAYAISRRRTEIGIRMALGAAPTRVIALVLARISMLVGAGIVVGTGVSLWASKFVGGLIYDVPARDPMTLIGAALVLCATGALAALLPARRAAHIDPGSVLREG